MLDVRGLQAGYGTVQVLFDVSLSVGVGQVVALLGRNGMGKTTTVSAVMGLLPPSGGSITLGTRRLRGLPPHRVAQCGLGLVPEGRQIFPTLTVEENLVATARPGAWTVARIWALFPQLMTRRGSLGRLLSGGEQQMLAIGRALMTNPALLILDEATEGLAPVVRTAIWSALAALKAEGLAILLIDKNVASVLRLADACVILEKGRTVWQGSSAALAAAPDIRDTYLHL